MLACCGLQRWFNAGRFAQGGAGGTALRMSESTAGPFLTSQNPELLACLLPGRDKLQKTETGVTCSLQLGTAWPSPPRAAKLHCRAPRGKQVTAVLLQERQDGTEAQGACSLKESQRARGSRARVPTQRKLRSTTREACGRAGSPRSPHYEPRLASYILLMAVVGACCAEQSC